eukprot:TRINITY_DN2977_c0_g3_i1.p1 TRINITY_DN2977_c0_g3~~TRINITY_DN2977_c0_g3_i1.p1  ORF type:complete len:541 (+),score=181.76 TRINITY_DN2977_c0_g3_i1:146-1768(+)
MNKAPSKEDWRERKALEEARKAGTVAPEQDEDGKDINPHIPQYISEAPWYLNRKGPGLKHQKVFKQQPIFDKDWYQRGVKGPAATKFRKGACTNCGAMTHAAKLCVERPRKVGARWTGQDIKPDEAIQDLLLDYDGKRDRWNGYDPAEHRKVMDQFEKIEEERRRKKKEELDKFMTEPDAAHDKFPHDKEAKSKEPADSLVDNKSDSDSEFGSDNEDEDDEFKDNTEAAVGVKRDARTRTTVRNLRIREDVAKYLLNLNPDSAHYDPKSGAMRENPTPGNPNALFQGENFVRASGDVKKFYEAQTFAFTSSDSGLPVHLQSMPSAAELIFKSTTETTQTATKKSQEEILAKYGGKEHLNADKSLLLAQSEEYVEYARDGRQIKGSSQSRIARSKYEEDVLILNHTKIWGSYWEDGQWGYGCCCQFIKQSYCTGKAGVDARKEIQQAMLARANEKSLVEQHAADGKKQPKKKETEQEKQARFQKALKDEDSRAKGVEKDERKRSYNSFKDTTEVTDEQMEAYRLKRVHADDPMAAYLSKKD